MSRFGIQDLPKVQIAHGRQTAPFDHVGDPKTPPAGPCRKTVVKTSHKVSARTA